MKITITEPLKKVMTTPPPPPPPSTHPFPARWIPGLDVMTIGLFFP